VLTYHSQILFEPVVAVEMFVLDGKPESPSARRDRG
jgi:hypothetical protein